MSPDEIKPAIDKLGLSQGRLAMILHTKTTTINEWERGVSSPDGGAVAAIEMLLWMKEAGTLDSYLDSRHAWTGLRRQWGYGPR